MVEEAFGRVMEKFDAVGDAVGWGYDCPSAPVLTYGVAVGVGVGVAVADGTGTPGIYCQA